MQARSKSESGRGALAERVALVTGGGRGIGRAIAHAFAEQGAAVAVAARTRAQIDAVAEQCRAMGAEAIAVQLDVTDRCSCDAAAEACEAAWGHVDILVNNAGSAMSHKFTDTADEMWAETLTVNLTGPFYMTRAVVPGMVARASGAIIAISSIAGKAGGPYIAPYSAAKHGLIGLMRSLAAEYAHSGVTFNCVCPAYVDTPMTEEAIQRIMEVTGRTRERARQALLTPQGRLIEPEEVAALCVLLAGPQGRSITGQAINVDGGMLQC